MRHVNAIVLRARGGPEGLEAVQFPLPEPAPGQVRVKVAAVALNHLAPYPEPLSFPEAAAPILPFLTAWQMASRLAVLGHVAAGRLSPVVHQVLPLARAADAHRILENREASGKVVLEP